MTASNLILRAQRSKGCVAGDVNTNPHRGILLNSKKVSSYSQGDFVALALAQMFRIYYSFLWPHLISEENENIIPVKGNPTAGFPDNPP